MKYYFITSGINHTKNDGGFPGQAAWWHMGREKFEKDFFGNDVKILHFDYGVSGDECTRTVYIALVHASEPNRQFEGNIFDHLNNATKLPESQWITLDRLLDLVG